MNTKKWTEIARTGTFTDSRGRPQEFTASDLEAIATAYDPTQRDAPLVFGHPKDNAPAFGWVQQLKSEGQKLFASFAHVPDSVKQLVNNKHYRHVSMSLMPDRVSLRHVALLGAAQPAIDGLEAVELTDGEDVICIDFTQIEPSTGGNMPTSEALQQQIGALQQQLEAMKTENATLKKKLEETGAAKDSAEADKADAAKKTETTAAEFAAYKGSVEKEKRTGRVATLIQAGKLKPAEQEDVLAFAAMLSTVPEPVEFSAADGKKESISAEERYFRELETRPVDGRFADFTAPPPAHAGGQVPTYTAADMAKKL